MLAAGAESEPTVSAVAASAFADTWLGGLQMTGSFAAGRCTEKVPHSVGRLWGSR